MKSLIWNVIGTFNRKNPVSLKSFLSLFFGSTPLESSPGFIYSQNLNHLNTIRAFFNKYLQQRKIVLKLTWFYREVVVTHRSKYCCRKVDKNLDLKITTSPGIADNNLSHFSASRWLIKSRSNIKKRSNEVKWTRLRIRF